MHGGDATQSLRYSVVIPLYDCRDAGDRALASALDQHFPGERFETIVVLDADAPPPTPLVSRCTRMVSVRADFKKIESEIPLFMAGARAARGDYLFFMEAHTVLSPDALQAFDTFLSARGDCAIVCGRRRNHARTALGRLVSMHNDAHQRGAQTRGDFALGANCIIRREAFERLGELDPDYMRFAETALYERAKLANERIETLDAILCTHHNDLGFARLLLLLVSTGRARVRYYASVPTRVAGNDVRRIYRCLDSRIAAALSALPFFLVGTSLIVVAIAMVRLASRVAGSAYRIGVGCVNVAGFCWERARAPRAVRRVAGIDSVGQDT